MGRCIAGRFGMVGKMARVLLAVALVGVLCLILGCSSQEKAQATPQAQTHAKAAPLASGEGRDSASLQAQSGRSSTQTKVRIGSKAFTMKLATTEAASAFRAYLVKSRTLKMKELNGNEKYRYLPMELPSNPKHVKKVKVGDVMLYGDDCLVIFYKAHKTSYEYTRIGRLANAKGLAKAAGKGSVKVKFAKMGQVAQGEGGADASSAQPSGGAADDLGSDSSGGQGSAAGDGVASSESSDASGASLSSEPRESGPAAGEQPASGSPAGDASGAASPTAPAAAKIQVTVNGHTLAATLADNDAARELAQMLASGPLTLDAHEYGGFEKVATLGSSLPRSDAQMTTSPGDIVLYQGNQVCFHYGSNAWSYTLLARIDDASLLDMASILGSGHTTVTLTLGS